MQNKVVMLHNRDTNLKLMHMLQIKDLLNLCQTNKAFTHLCNDEGFWRQRYQRDYGSEAASFKNPDRKWKDYYLLTLYYDEKYYPTKAVRKVARKGYEDLIQFFISKGAETSRIAEYAAEGGFEALTRKYMDTPSYTDWISGAAYKSGLTDLENETGGVTSLPKLIAAAELGDADAVGDALNDSEYLNHGHITAVAKAIKHDKMNIVDLILYAYESGMDHTYESWQDPIREAVAKKDEELVKRLWNIAKINQRDPRTGGLRWDADLFSGAIEGAAKIGDLDLLQYYVSLANERGYIFPSKYIDDGSSIFYAAKSYLKHRDNKNYLNYHKNYLNYYKKYLDVIDFLIESGIGVVEQARKLANRKGLKEVEKFLANYPTENKYDR